MVRVNYFLLKNGFILLDFYDLTSRGDFFSSMVYRLRLEILCTLEKCFAYCENSRFQKKHFYA